MKKILLSLALAASILLCGCSEADKANTNISKQDGKSIFGSGLLLCERAAAERAAVRWELSNREKAIMQQLG